MEFLKFTIEPWVTTREEVEYTTKIFKLLSREMKIESEDHSATFSVLNAPDWVNIVPLTENGEVVLVEQYRYGTEEPTLELPGGMVDPGENPRECSERELLEETGFKAASWTDLGKVSSNPAILTNYTHTWLAEGCVKVQEQQLDGNERIHVHLVPLDEFLRLIHTGHVHHSLVVAAMAKFMLHQRNTNP